MQAAARQIPTLNDAEYAGFQRLVAESSGISLGASKRQLLFGRLVRVLRARGIGSFGAYLDLIHADRSGAELVGLLDLVATNETRFFRERGHYEYLAAWLDERRAAVAAGARQPHVRAWSAACSTGQEPYSVAMTLLDACPAHEGWTVDILGSDISTRALRAARQGEYDVARSAEIPEPARQRFMLRGVGGRAGRMRAGAELRSAVRFRRINLIDELDAVEGRFDLIFCCNALIYFSRDGRADVVRRLAGKLAPDGRFFVGHAETLHEHRDILRPVAPTVYAHATDHHDRDLQS